MTLLMLGLYLPLWLCYGRAQSSYLDSYVSFPGKIIVSVRLCASVCVGARVCVSVCVHFSVCALQCANDHTDVLN